MAGFASATLVLALLGSPAEASPETDEGSELVEGPALPPEPAPSPSDSDDGGYSGIEFAVPPPELDETQPPAEPVGNGVTTPLPVRPEAEREPLGQAPPNGGSWIAGGAFLIPFSLYGMNILLASDAELGRSTRSSEIAILVAGSAMGAGGIAMIGIGIHRAVKLRRWARRHRVQALPQGGALLTFGTLGLLGGLAMVITHADAADPIDRTYLGIGSALIATAPIEIAVGSYYARRWQTRGGWRRLQPRLTIAPTPFGLVGRF